MREGVQEKELPYNEMITETFLCKHDGGLVIFKHDKFFINRHLKTGITYLECARCNAIYELDGGELK